MSSAQFIDTAPTGNLRVGIDMVRISRIRESVEQFGEKFLSRIFTPREVAYAVSSPACRDERLAARFAAKEAAMKALRLTDRGIPWTDVEVAREPSGECSLALHGQALQHCGRYELALSLSHEGDYATAVVMVQRATR
jgi:holo-[acyl-carrier protein] synthase